MHLLGLVSRLTLETMLASSKGGYKTKNNSRRDKEIFSALLIEAGGCREPRAEPRSSAVEMAGHPSKRRYLSTSNTSAPRLSNLWATFRQLSRTLDAGLPQNAPCSDVTAARKLTLQSRHGANQPDDREFR